MFCGKCSKVDYVDLQVGFGASVEVACIHLRGKFPRNLGSSGNYSRGGIDAQAGRQLARAEGRCVLGKNLIVDGLSFLDGDRLTRNDRCRAGGVSVARTINPRHLVCR